MKARNLISLALLALIVNPACLAQTQQDYIPTAKTLPPDVSPPSEALARLTPYLGFYEFTGDFSSESYKGTLEVKPAVKGWYVEWVINIHVDGKTNQYERQLRMLTTWDRFAEQYRIWRFETNNPVVLGEGKARFEGNEFIMEWRQSAPDGEMATFRNRVSLKKTRDVVIITEGERDSGGIEQIGVGMGKRRHLPLVPLSR